MISSYALLHFLFPLSSIGLVLTGLAKGKYILVPLGAGMGFLSYKYQPVILETLLNTYANLTFDEINYKKSLKAKQRDLSAVTYPIVYHPRYDITAWGIEKQHSFDSQKYGKIFDILQQRKLIDLSSVHQPTDPSRGLLLLAHTKEYLQELCHSDKLGRYVELPAIDKIPASILRWRLLDSMLLATQGTVDGGLLALQRGWAINLSGGYHHASGETGGGFCLYADITLCIKHLLKFCPEKVKKAMIIDLDAHRGNGHESDFVDNPNVFIIDAYHHSIYPYSKKGKEAIAVDISVTSADHDEKYLAKLQKDIPDAIRDYEPDFILYNAGTDCLVGDPLGGLSITAEGIKKRDEYIFKLALETFKVPILMVLSGGYQKNNAQVIADSITNLGNVFDLWNKETRKTKYSEEF